ncbi:MAG TPA: hypothetical protein VG844_03855 [Terracidiphilus sp.]|jgi:hypothetical protein|nr:hypothetical protein [Terracidiphilus sp.]
MSLQSINSAMRMSLSQRSSEDLVYQVFTIGSILLILGSVWVF